MKRNQSISRKKLQEKFHEISREIFKNVTNYFTWIKGEAFVGDPICDPGEEAAKGLIFCTGLDNNAAKVISLVESAFDLIPEPEIDGEPEPEVEAAGDDIAWPLTNRSNKDDPEPTLFTLEGSTSEFSKACKLGAALVLAVTSLVLKKIIILWFDGKSFNLRKPK